MNFGGALVVLRYKLFLALSIFSVSGCAASFEERFEDYANKIEKCKVIELENSESFPMTPWFVSLNEEEQKRVVLYLSIDNRDNCSKTEREALKDSESKLSQEQRSLFDAMGVTDPPNHAQYIDGLDLKEIQKIQSLYEMPFDSIKLGESLGLLR
ncbi:hypothetical protein [Vibrio sp. B181a]|uniref:hypothetical protein n=1 Tax=Vibrio sp. B181a TaxID=2835906 RepID=UPI002552DEB6|nr:hypothetical protein [Vibrio sp. B181a]MDK9774831.1 hypothetical protein [Vibrio sp. B181a]